MSFSRRDFLLRSAGFVTVSAMVPKWSVAASRGFEAVEADAALAMGVNVYAGQVTNPGVAQAHDLPLTPLAAPYHDMMRTALREAGCL